MFMDVGNPGFFKIVESVRYSLNIHNSPIRQFGNPLVFEAARIWIRWYETMSITGGEEWAFDKMVHKHYDEFIDMAIKGAYDKIVERIGVEVGAENYVRKAQKHGCKRNQQTQSEAGRRNASPVSGKIPFQAEGVRSCGEKCVLARDGKNGGLL